MTNGETEYKLHQGRKFYLAASLGLTGIVPNEPQPPVDWSIVAGLTAMFVGSWMAVFGLAWAVISIGSWLGGGC